MTKLFLNNRQAVLPEGLNFKFILDNPYFTKSSNYSHDIILPLAGCIENQKIFGHIHLNHIKKIIQPIEAILLVDNLCLLKGSAIIRNINEKEVKIQLISGNSEFNYFFKNDVYVDRLDLGQAEEVPDINNIELNIADLQRIDKWWGTYPERNYCFYPVFNAAKNYVLNRIVAVYNNDSYTQYKFRFSAQEMLYVVGKLSVQPFLCFLIRKITEALGYRLKENQLENSFLKNIIVCNGIDSKCFADSLPHWTVVQFFEEIEKLFGAITLVDETSKEVRILLMKNYYNESESCAINNVIDEYEVNVDLEDTTDVSNGNVGYGVDSSFFKYRKIKKDITGYATSKKFDSYAAMMDYYTAMTSVDKKKTLFEWDNRQFIHFSENGNSKLKEVNGFRDLIRNPESDKTDIEFNIIPAEFAQAYGSVYNGAIQRWEGTVAVLTVPGDKNSLKDSLDIQGVIEGSTDYSEDEQTSKMYIALSDGVYQKMVGSYSNEIVNHPFPWPYIDGTDHLLNDQYDRKYSLQLYPKENIDTLGKICFTDLRKVDTTKGFQFRYLSEMIPDPKKIYLVNYKRYVAHSFELTITDQGIDKMKLAKLYSLE